MSGAPQVRSWLITEVLEYLAPEARPRFMLQVGSELRAFYERGRRDREAWAPLGRRKAIRVEKIACRCERALSCDYRVSWEDS